jgi:hypothetical protein
MILMCGPQKESPYNLTDFEGTTRVEVTIKLAEIRAREKGLDLE